MFRKGKLCLRFRLSVPIFRETLRRSMFGALVCAWAAMVLPAPDCAQSLSVPPVSQPKTTVFLADPQLGIAGAYQTGDATIYFETRTPDGSTEMSARLLDSTGRTIAISGHSMDAEWLPKTPVDNARAAQSLGLAGGLPAALAGAFDNIAFSSELALVSSLATGVKGASPDPAALRFDAASAAQTTVSESDREAGIRAYEQSAATGLKSNRDSAGNFNSAFGETRVMTVVNSFPDGENEDDPDVLGRTEVNGQILTPEGRAIIQQFGGDDIPEGWDFGSAASATPTDPIQAGVEAGTAIRAAALTERYSSATPDEAAAIGNLAEQLRSQGMFPSPDVATVTSASEPPATGDANLPWEYRTQVEVWNKGLAGVAQHSGTIVYDIRQAPNFVPPEIERTLIFCNHGTCPRDKPMNHAATCTGNWTAGYHNPPYEKITAPPPSPPSGYHSCYKTPYHLNGGFPFPWDHGHNCNDDTWTQIHAVLQKPYAISNGARCDDHALDPRAPGCND